jgi:hypothetical protein
MRSGCKTWLARLIATVATFALVLACTLGAYAHAAGHPHLPAGHASQDVTERSESGDETAGHIHAAHDHVGYTHVGHGQAGHDGGDADRSDTDCCNALCGAHAIPAVAPLFPHPLLAAPPMQPEVALDSAVASGLERPPRAPVPA